LGPARKALDGPRCKEGNGPDPDAEDLTEPIYALTEAEMGDKLSSRARPFPKAMLGAKGWMVIMAVVIVVAFVIFHYLKIL
jgi:hypothetical protein